MFYRALNGKLCFIEINFNKNVNFNILTWKTKKKEIFIFFCQICSLKSIFSRVGIFQFCSVGYRVENKKKNFEAFLITIGLLICMIFDGIVLDFHEKSQIGFDFLRFSFLF